MTLNWVSAIALAGWLILALSALRARQLDARKGVVYALLWGAIFLGVTAVFAMVE
jgi:hypothetical protein